MQSPRRLLSAAAWGVEFDGSEYIGVTWALATVTRFLHQFVAHGMMTAATEAAPTILR